MIGSHEIIKGVSIELIWKFEFGQFFTSPNFRHHKKLFPFRILLDHALTFWPFISRSRPTLQIVVQFSIKGLVSKSLGRVLQMQSQSGCEVLIDHQLELVTVCSD